VAAGLVDGDVQANQLVEVSSQGEIQGQIAAPAMKVQPGARLRGAASDRPKLGTRGA
jgi:cytoskeletal protein CcmA (bactofilin family)